MRKTILEVVVGSTLHGTAVQDGLEDLDIMAVVLEDKTEFVGLYPEDTWTHRTKPEGVRSEAGDVDHVAYGLRKYLRLAMRGNPTILLALFAKDPFIHVQSPEGYQLQQMAPYIVSRLAYAPFRGYMKQQHERLLDVRGQRNVTRPELVEKYGYDVKYAGHIIRLGLQGQELLLTGRITLPMPEEQRNLVLGVRTGAYTLHQVSAMIEDVEKQLQGAGGASPLQKTPDARHIERWMMDTYLKHWITAG